MGAACTIYVMFQEIVKRLSPGSRYSNWKRSRLEKMGAAFTNEGLRGKQVFTRSLQKISLRP